MLRSKQPRTFTVENKSEVTPVTSVTLKIKSPQQQIEQMHKEYGALTSAPAPTHSSPAEVHARYETLLINHGGSPVTSDSPQDYHPTLTPARVDIESSSVQNGLGEAIAHRTAAMAAAIINVPGEDPEITATFAPIIQSAEKHAISKVDNAQSKRALWIWGAAVVGIAAGTVLVLGRRSKQESKNN